MTDPYIPLVTIAIPTYNRASSYLVQALQSALDQTYSRIEIVVSDNCSSDNTEQLVNSFTDPRIRYFRHAENIGLEGNWNFCVEEARGSYILMLHDDDLIDHDFIEVCMTEANYATHFGTIRTGLRLIDSQGNSFAHQANMVCGLSTEDFIFAWMEGKTWPYPCNTLLNTQGLKEIGGFKCKDDLFCDVTAALKLAARFGRFDIETIKASSREHEGEVTVLAKVMDWCEDSLKLLDLLCELVPDNKSLVRQKGMKFFTLINYYKVKEIRAPWKKIRLYFMVYKKFDSAYSPIVYLFNRNFLVKILYSVAARVRRLSGRFIPAS